MQTADGGRQGRIRMSALLGRGGDGAPQQQKAAGSATDSPARKKWWWGTAAARAGRQAAGGREGKEAVGHRSKASQTAGRRRPLGSRSARGTAREEARRCETAAEAARLATELG